MPLRAVRLGEGRFPMSANVGLLPSVVRFLTRWRNCFGSGVDVGCRAAFGAGSRHPLHQEDAQDDAPCAPRRCGPPY